LAAERQSVLHGHLELQFAAARYEWPASIQLTSTASGKIMEWHNGTRHSSADVMPPG
jgi:hypothetical protein